jgi:hypothetical protein
MRTEVDGIVVNDGNDEEAQLNVVINKNEESSYNFCGSGNGYEDDNDGNSSENFVRRHRAYGTALKMSGRSKFNSTYNENGEDEAGYSLDNNPIGYCDNQWEGQYYQNY